VRGTSSLIRTCSSVKLINDCLCSFYSCVSLYVGHLFVAPSLACSLCRVIDTTNRSVVLEAARDGFDPDGFRDGKGLQKELFYMNPYISCQW
jgi:hypothetical protein